MAVAGTSRVFVADAFGVPTTATNPPTTSRINLALNMKPENTSIRSSQSRTTKGTPSSELTARKAALVDSSHLSKDNPGIRDRVNSFLRSKKKKSKVVQEVKDIDSIHSVLGEGQKEAVYTAVIFHAPYCRACKASMPLFEELARQYNKKNRTYTKQQKKRSWMASSSSSSDEYVEKPRKQPVVKFLSVPVTQANSKELQDQFSVTKFPLAHIYDPVDGLVDERPVLRKLFSAFEERLESVVVEAFAESSSSSAPALAFNATMA
eukprot:CAMPEP_0116126110 /NCGR_PEP_ID=MMETSP0329-20121206/6163_1 /TAXON_ID=697910 /ORGANISM="Pseudo-nitzschia arenysensis, Strain B593" /LENGTH=263 /DNA_ID=CAMNT_0003620183 /DNA_START=655 /DNA_END=1446 /DNA_ORIENTATION=+